MPETSVKLPPGYQLEEDVKVPPGYQLEGGEATPSTWVGDDPNNVYLRTENGVPVFGRPPGITTPKPPELQTDAEVRKNAPVWRNPRTGTVSPMLPPGMQGGPLGFLDDPITGAQKVVEGFQRAGGASSMRDVAGGVSQMLRGGFEMTTPALVGSGVTAPVRTAVNLGLAMGAGGAAEGALKALGLPEEYSALAGDLAALLGGAAAHKYLGKLSEFIKQKEATSENTADDIFKALQAQLDKLKDPSTPPEERDALRKSIEHGLENLRGEERGGAFRNPNAMERDAYQYMRNTVGTAPNAGAATGSPFVRGSQHMSGMTPAGAVMDVGAEKTNIRAMQRNADRLVSEAMPEGAPAREHYAEWERQVGDSQPGKIQVGEDEDGSPIYAKLKVPGDISALKEEMLPVFQKMQFMPMKDRSASSAYSALQTLLDSPDAITAPTLEFGLSQLKRAARNEPGGISEAITKQIIPHLQAIIDHATEAYLGDEALASLKKGRAAAAKEAGAEWLSDQFAKAKAEGGFDHEKALWNNWQRLNETEKRTMFTPKQVEELNKFFLGLRMYAENPNPSGSALTGAIGAQAGYALRGGFADPSFWWMQLGAGALSKLLRSDVGIKLLTEKLRLPLRNTEKSRFIDKKLKEITGGEGGNPPEQGPPAAGGPGPSTPPPATPPRAAAPAAAPAADGGRVLKHWTTPESAAALQSGSPFDASRPPVHGVGSMDRGAKTEKEAGNRLYLSLEDGAWNKGSRYTGKGFQVPATEENVAKHPDSPAYFDYKAQKWMLDVGSHENLDLVPVDYRIRPDAKVLTIDSPEALKKAQEIAGVHSSSPAFYDNLQKAGYDVVEIRNAQKIGDDERNSNYKFFRAAKGDQAIVLNQDVASLANQQQQKPGFRNKAKEAFNKAKEIGKQVLEDEEGSLKLGDWRRRKPQDPIAAVGLKYLMDNPLEVARRGDNGQVKTIDVGREIRNAARSNGGSLAPNSDPELRGSRAAAAMAEDLKYALASQPEAREWYTGSVGKMESQLTENRPEFKDDAKRSLFKFLLGVTSNGVDPDTNFDAAMRGWDLYKEHGKLMAYDPGRKSELSNSGQVGLTFRANSYETAMGVLNRLVQEKGEAGAVDWLRSKHSIAELKKYDPKITLGDGSDRYGAYVLGEKVGSFGLNLNGVYTELTADKWWSRTWNRWMGTTIATDKEGKFKYKDGEPLMQDDPRNESERALMRQTATKVAGELKLTVAELQAVLWYAEQALYRAHGLVAGSAAYDTAATKFFSKRNASAPGSGLPSSPSSQPSGTRPGTSRSRRQVLQE